MTEAYIYDVVRTPRGKGKRSGALYQSTPVSLASSVLRAIQQRNGLDTALVDDVVLGCVEATGEQGADIARSAVLLAGYAETAAGVTVNRFCASGLEACNMAAAKVICGEADLAIGGGVESMSRVPMGSSGGALFDDPSVAFPAHSVPQGISADLLATLRGYSRNDLDCYALQSQLRAAAAQRNGYFQKSMVPVVDMNGATILDHDELIRPDTTIEDLARLEPAFAAMGEKFGYDATAVQRYPGVEAIRHLHHAGNSSGIADGAAAVLIGNREMGRRLGLTPRARFRSFASIGSEPCIMLTGPVPATKKALAKAGIAASDVRLFEVNEAFAAVVLCFMEEVGVPHDRVNVNGGAIAMGHPLGATGAVLLGTLLDEMERRNVETGITTLCVGGGMGTATLIERV
ncbi:MAG TPA: acetyl-CoA C-acetyltransferase [Bryobacteraceae bacterium]|nr:acetyl-CoA C-acetyltransferase [Bryobacteraceae bacterium]